MYLNGRTVFLPGRVAGIGREPGRRLVAGAQQDAERPALPAAYATNAC